MSPGTRMQKVLFLEGLSRNYEAEGHASEGRLVAALRQRCSSAMCLEKSSYSSQRPREPKRSP